MEIEMILLFPITRCKPVRHECGSPPHQYLVRCVVFLVCRRIYFQLAVGTYSHLLNFLLPFITVTLF